MGVVGAAQNIAAGRVCPVVVTLAVAAVAVDDDAGPVDVAGAAESIVAAELDFLGVFYVVWH